MSDLFDMLDLSTVVNGGAGLAALYLAIKINATLDAVTKMLKALQTEVADLKGRVTQLEAGRKRAKKKRAIL